jgi:uncharacterized protein (TIGR02265 family)
MNHERKILDEGVKTLLGILKDDQLTPTLRRKLHELGLEPGTKLKPVYPYAVFTQALVAVSEELWPARPYVECQRELGRRAVAQYFDSLMGIALKRLSKTLGLRRTLGRMTQNFSGTNNYTETRLRELSETHYELWMNEAPTTQHYVLGVLEAGLQMTSGKDVKVAIASTDSDGCTYDVSWS